VKKQKLPTVTKYKQDDKKKVAIMLRINTENKHNSITDEKI